MRPKAMATANFPIMDRAMARALMSCRRVKIRKFISILESFLLAALYMSMNKHGATCTHAHPYYVQLVKI